MSVGSRRGSRQIEQVVLLGDVAADLAEAHLVAHLEEDLGEPGHVEVLGLHDVERDALRRLRADAGQAPEFVDQFLDDAFVHGLPTLPEAGAAGRLDLFEERRAEHLAHHGLAVALDAAVGGRPRRRARAARATARAPRRRARGPDLDRTAGSTSSAARRRRRRVGVVGQRRRWRRMPRPAPRRAPSPSGAPNRPPMRRPARRLGLGGDRRRSPTSRRRPVRRRRRCGSASVPIATVGPRCRPAAASAPMRRWPSGPAVVASRRSPSARGRARLLRADGTPMRLHRRPRHAATRRAPRIVLGGATGAVSPATGREPAPAVVGGRRVGAAPGAAGRRARPAPRPGDELHA